MDHWLGDANHKHFTYAYDPRHQLTGVGETSGAFTASYGYSTDGRFSYATELAAFLPNSDVKNRDVAYQYEGNDPEEVTSLVSAQGASTFATYTYDDAGNQTSRSYPDTGESWNFIYDGKDQLRRATKLVNGSIQASQEYWYDQSGTRNIVVKRGNAGLLSELIWFIGDTEAHYDATGIITKTYDNVSMGAPVMRIERTDADTTVEYQFHGLASNTIAAVDQATGSLNASFDYAPFGEIIEATDSVTDGIATHRRRVNDKYDDEISGLTYYGARYYDRTSMSWTQADPVYRFAPDAAQLSPRRAALYVDDLDNPLRYIDPDGRDTIGAIKSAASALLDADAAVLEGANDALDSTVDGIISQVKNPTQAVLVTAGLSNPALLTIPAVSDAFEHAVVGQVAGLAGTASQLGGQIASGDILGALRTLSAVATSVAIGDATGNLGAGDAPAAKLGAGDGATVTRYHGTTAQAATRIAKTGFKLVDTFFTGDKDSAYAWAKEKATSSTAGGMRAMKFTVPRALAKELGLMEQHIVGESTGLRFNDNGGGLEHILPAENVAKFNQALGDGTISLQRFRYELEK